MIVEAHDVWKRYGRLEALQGVEFGIEEGSAFALLGPNGAGKTTVIKILMNLLRPSRGNTAILGTDSRSISPRELARIGYVSENQRMPGGLTVAQFLAYLSGFYPRWDKDLERTMLRDLDLPPSRKIRDLSHGMRIKTALLCATVFRPRLLVLDEPFAGLDPLVRDEIMTGMLRRADDLTILISSHELSEIENFATDAAFLQAGRVLFQESMSGLIGRFREVDVTLDSSAAVPRSVPSHWLRPRVMGSMFTFVETEYSENHTAKLIRALFDDVRQIEARPMTLRSIFTSLAAAGKGGL